MTHTMKGKIKMCIVKGYVVNQPELSFLTSTYPYDKICRFFVVKNADNQYVADIYPIVCFGKLASDVVDKIKPNTFIKVNGLLKDFNYKDYNLTSHRTKVFVAESIDKIDKEEIDYTLYEKTYDELIKNNINVIDLSEFDRLERTINSKKEVVQC